MGFVLKTVFSLATISHVSLAIIINITDDSIELPVNISIPDDELTICTSLRFGEKIAAVKLFGEFGDNLSLLVRYVWRYMKVDMDLLGSKMFTIFFFYPRILDFNH